MRVTFHSEISGFLAQAESLLLQNEAANSLMLGLSSRLLTESMPLPLLVTLKEGSEVVTPALQLPPFNLVLTFAKPAHLEILAEKLWKRRCTFQGVVGPSKEARAFAALWHKRSRMKVHLGMDQRIYQLSKVKFPRETKGQMRTAVANEVPLIMRWLEEFRLESLPHEPQATARLRGMAEKRVQAGEFFLWEAGGKPVCMAGVAGPTQNGIRINAVFTPKAQRKKGYASALVAHLSQKMLESGRKFCFLYTDLSNPTSNGIYQNVGYEAVCDSRHYIFTAKE